MLQGDYLVEKSMSLVWAKLTDYGTGELKILDTYLSRIDARKPESSRVIFTKKEYAELMGLDADIRASQLKVYTAKLLKNIVTIDLPDGRKGYKQYPLFHEAECEFDENMGQTVIRIDCHPKLKQVFFDIAENRYIKYQLKNTIALKSQYSVRLYSLLMARRKYGWTVDVDELRERLNANNKAYAEFKRFNDLVVKRAVKEINEITNMDVEIEYIKQGRSVVKVKFNVSVTEPEPPNVIDVEPISVEIVEDNEPATVDYSESAFSEGLRAKIDQWLRYKTERREEYHPTGLQSLIAQLQNNVDKHGEEAVMNLIDECMASGYRGIIFDRLNQKQASGGRKDPEPAWMKNNDQQQTFDDRLKKDMEWLKQFDQQQKTVGNDPELAARAEALKQQIHGFTGSSQE